MIKVGIVGITGFTGLELIKILLNHNEATIEHVCSRSEVGKKICEVYPQFRGVFDKDIEAIDIDEICKVDVIFLALPHTVSAGFAKKLYGKTKIVDLSADFRLRDVKEYEKWYKTNHIAKELLNGAVYGLVELNREQIKGADLIANPGCYATSVILAVAPVAKYSVGTIISDSKSGVSGAGRRLKEGLEFCEVNENFKAYSIYGHRHIPEMEQELRKINQNVKIEFIPHLLPIQRGILSTVYIKVNKKLDFVKLYKEFYGKDYFVRVIDTPPTINNIKGTNFCDLYVYFDERTDMLIVVSVIDNLIKGASGQAVQNMNVMFGIDEKEGLGGYSYYP